MSISVCAIVTRSEPANCIVRAPSAVCEAGHYKDTAQEGSRPSNGRGDLDWRSELSSMAIGQLDPERRFIGLNRRKEVCANLLVPGQERWNST